MALHFTIERLNSERSAFSMRESGGRHFAISFGRELAIEFPCNNCGVYGNARLSAAATRPYTSVFGEVESEAEDVYVCGCCKTRLPSTWPALAYHTADASEHVARVLQERFSFDPLTAAVDAAALIDLAFALYDEYYARLCPAVEGGSDSRHRWLSREKHDADFLPKIFTMGSG